MKICANCSREMRCVKTGVLCIFGASHTYAGDLFECPTCLNQMIVTSASPFTLSASIAAVEASGGMAFQMKED